LALDGCEQSASQANCFTSREERI